MSETSPAQIPPARPLPPNDAMGGASDLRSLAIVCYALFLLGCINGLTTFIGVIIAYVKRRDASGTIWRSHFDNLIFVFWVMVGVTILGFLVWPLAFGAFFVSGAIFWPPALSLPFLFWFLAFPLLVLWYLYRIIRGLIRASEERPY
jgi:uncharacterized membrane protein